MAHDTHPALRRQAAGFARHHTTDVFEFVPVLELQDFYNACAGATLPNPASVGLHESVGFRSVGVYRGVGYKLGAWHDVVWWHLPLRERVADPDPPADLASILSSEGWDTAMTNGLPLLRSGP